ncbi:hypothetical protein BH09ACT6_BH09ACT6_13560 [soil metagenome]
MLEPSDPVAEFDCGETSLDIWLSGRAIKNEATGASRAFVSVERERALIGGSYSVSTGSLSLNIAPGTLRRNMPSPIPVVLIGRLAVDERFTGSGLGASLLQDALLKCIEAARSVGIRAIVVDAPNEASASFYRKFGFESMPLVRDGAMYLVVKNTEATIPAGLYLPVHCCSMTHSSALSECGDPETTSGSGCIYPRNSPAVSG